MIESWHDVGIKYAQMGSIREEFLGLGGVAIVIFGDMPTDVTWRGKNG